MGGKIIGLQGIFWDITEQQRAEERIRQANIELARSREDLRAKNQLMQDNLRMAREIQTAMLPQLYPVFPPVVAPAQSAFQFTHRYHPAESVSGDFFSVTALSDTEVGVFICDVAGHGVRAALVTAMIRALAEELKPLARDPGQFLRKLNSDLCAILKSTGSPMLTTAFYLVADWQSGRLRFSNAGHPKPLLIRRSRQSVEPLANDSGRSQPALGLFDDPPYQTTEKTIEPGDFLMLFTDGLYEVQGANEELYSQQRLMVDVQHLLGQPAGNLFDNLLATVRTFSNDREFEDDVCLVGMEFIGKPPAN
jgi:phosphoserine phosphatase RsbU/P